MASRFLLTPAARSGACGLLLAAAATAHAAVVDFADIGGFRTFQDTLTGNVWVDLDGRFGPRVSGTPAAASISHASFGAYQAALEAAGFTWATSSQVMALLDSLDFSPNAATATAQARGHAAVMSTLWFDELQTVMGLAENTGTPTGQRRHGLVFSSLPFWGTFASNQDFNVPSDSAFGLWAFQAAPAAGPGPAPVPEPASWGLAGLALAALAVQRRRRTAGHGAWR